MERVMFRGKTCRGAGSKPARGEGQPRAWSHGTQYQGWAGKKEVKNRPGTIPRGGGKIIKLRLCRVLHRGALDVECVRRKFGAKEGKKATAGKACGRLFNLLRTEREKK